MPNNKSDQAPNYEWHLGHDQFENALSRLELALFSVLESQSRWQRECVVVTKGEISMSGSDNTLLNVIRMFDRPKGVSEIAHILNRDDLSNIQYCIRKLQTLGLVTKSTGKGSRKDVTYKVTAQGKQITEAFSQLRRELLVKAFQSAGLSEERISELADQLILMTGLYESAARDVTLSNMLPKK